MVSDDRRQPQRKSTRPASGDQQQWRSTGARPAGSRSGSSQVPSRAKALREYESNQPQSRSRAGAPPSITPRRATTGVSGSRGPATSRAQGSGGKGGGGGRGGANGGRFDRKGRPIPPWKFWLRRIGVGALVAGLGTALLGVIGLLIRYQTLDVPDPADFALEQSSTFYYADGTTVMGRLGEAERDIVDASTLPPHVSQVFVAAEDRSFYTNPGVDIGGTARAMFKTVVLGKKQGGSTISQQYVERYYVAKTTTSITGKIDEALLALKINKQQDKPEILSNYMNTVYFGRGAYGIEMAAQKYYGKPAAELTVSEAALLAGILPAPSRWDPRLNPERAEFRWNYVLDGMVDLGYLTQQERDAQVFPTTIEYLNTDVFGGTQGYLLQYAIEETERVAGITREDIETQGLTIVTTIQPSTQQAILASVAQMPEGAAPNLHVAAVTLDPTTGGITGMYGGADYLTVQRNAVTQDIAQAGSTFKPFALVAALENGVSLKSVYSGASGMSLPGFDKPVRNFGGKSYGDIDVVQATASSVNSVYAQMNLQVGPEKTREVAIKAGIPEDTAGLEDNPANVLGTASPHPLDMARAYATFANGGLAVDTFMVQSITLADGSVFYEHQVVPERVFGADVMADAVYAMQQVVNYKSGSGHFATELGRPVAGKTGTSNDNRSAWFVGFTPQQVGAVALYQVGPNGEAEEITPFGGFEQITGGSVPTRLWTWMMGPILANYPVVEFPAPAYVGVPATPSPSPSPSPTPSATPSPTPTPSAPAVSTPTPTPTPALPIPLPVP